MKLLTTWVFVLGALLLAGCGAENPLAGLPPLTQTAAYEATALCLARTAEGPVLMWELFGTPTLTPTPQYAVGTYAPTPTPSVTPQGYVDVAGDAGRGKVLFNGKAQCSTCHEVGQATTLVGPTLKGIATTAETREPGMSADAYMRKAIVQPWLLNVKGFVIGIMPRTYGASLKPGELNDLIAYLSTLK